jgi:hypothetical protein
MLTAAEAHKYGLEKAEEAEAQAAKMIVAMTNASLDEADTLVKLIVMASLYRSAAALVVNNATH